MSRTEFGISNLQLSTAEWPNVYRRHSGLIPIAIDRGSLRIMWQDLGAYHFYESFFHRSLDLFDALTRDAAARFETSLDVLYDGRGAHEAVPMAGLIFHAGRSRSTLLSRAIARSRENLVLSEPSALNTLLEIVADHPTWPRARASALCRNLILAMCRRRLATHQRAFVKCTSHNVAFAGLIRGAFPRVPAIFLSRDPGEIVASFRRSPPGWASTLGDVEPVVRRNLDHAVRAGLLHIDHRAVVAEQLAAVLRRFAYVPGAAQLKLMQGRFAFDSKEDFRHKEHVAGHRPDSAESE